MWAHLPHLGWSGPPLPRVEAIHWWAAAGDRGPVPNEHEMRVRSLSRLLCGTVLAAALGLVPAGPANASVPVLVLEGTGYGHGVGLSQWGSEYLARTGRSASDILATFYAGAQLGEATGSMRVAVHRPPVSSTTLTFPHDVSRCAAVATIGGTAPEDDRQDAAGVVHVAPGIAPAQVVVITLALATGEPTDLPFHFIVDC